MRRVTCRDCGRTYDYDQDDFCPKCGSYNPPANAGATELESQLLSRFDQNRARQNAPQSPADPPGRDPFAPRPPSAPPRVAPHLCVSPDEAPKRRRYLPVLIFLCVTAALLLFVLAPLLPTWGGQTADHSAHVMGESLSLGKLTVTVDGCGWLDVPEDSRLYREGYGILLVDLYAEGGDGYASSDPVGRAALLAGEDTILPETDPLVKNRLQSLGVYPTEVRNALWEDPLLGQLVFYVPIGPKGPSTATLVLEELRAGKDSPAATRSVELTLPTP